MKHNWHPEELNEHWTVSTNEKRLAQGKRHPLQLGYVVLLKFFQYQGRFPKSSREVPRRIIEHIAKQLKIAPTNWKNYDWSGRTVKYHRSEIRKLLGFREVTVADGEELANWLCEHCLSETRKTERIEDAAYGRLRVLRIEPPTPERLSRRFISLISGFANPYTSVCRQTSANGWSCCWIASMTRKPARLQGDVIYRHCEET